MERLYIVDGYGYIFRAYYGLMGGTRGIQLSNSSGMPTGALYVYARMLVKLYKETRPERVVVVFDHPGKSFRADIDPNYKATRRETPPDLLDQMPFFRPLTEGFCWPVVSAEGFEADDVIATIVTKAKKKQWPVTIFTGDKDLMQLVDENVEVIDALRNVTYDTAKVVDKFGVPPGQLRDWLALVGDKSDNVPGMPGVGKVTATKLLSAYGDIDGILENIEDMKGKQKERFSDPENQAQIRLSQDLVTLREDAPLEIPIEEMVPREWDGETLTKIFEELEFLSLLESVNAARDTPTTPEETEVTILDNDDAIVAFAEQMAAAKEMTVFPLTLGKRWTDSRLIGLAVGITDGPVGYLPLAHRTLDSSSMSWDEVDERFKAALKSATPVTICHDSKECHKRLEKAGVEMSSNVFDAMLAYFLTGAGRDASDHEKLLAALGLSCEKIPKDPDTWPVANAAQVCGRITVLLATAAKTLRKHLKKLDVEHLLVELEQPLANLLADIERTGIVVNTDYLGELGAELKQQIKTLETRIHEIADEKFNVGSPKQLSKFLFEDLGLVASQMKKTKTGYSTDASVLESLKGKHEVIEPILEHRQLTKLLGTYIEAIPPLINPDTERLHTTFAQAIAATGRLSSKDPNLQNIPIRTEIGRKIRRAFVAPPGKTLVSCDYSQIELRIMAHLSADPVLVKAFQDGVDVHAQTAAEVFEVPVEDVDAEQRRVAKAVNYGLMYGQAAFGLSRALGIKRRDAKKYIEMYFERFSKVAEFMEQAVEDAKKHGFAKTIFGRVRPVPDIRAGNFQRRKAAERIAQNTPVQGAAADIMKRAMLDVDATLKSNKLPAVILLTVHDELVLEVDDAAAEDTAAAVAIAMTGAADLAVPLVVDTGAGPHWGAAH